VEAWIGEQLVEAQAHRAQLQRAADRARLHLVQVEQRLHRVQDRYDEALDGGDDDLGVAVERQLTRLVKEHDESVQAVAEADTRVQEWNLEPDLDEARRWLENVIAQVEGRVARAEGVAAVRAAIRSVVDDINVREVLDDQDRPLGLNTGRF
jgi:paraquat-inducible protein B